MAKTTPRPRASVLFSLLMSAGLLALFFMPWLKVSCNAQAATNAAQLNDLPNLPEELTRPTVLATASGWDLARGELTPADKFKGQAQAAQKSEQRPPEKYWAYAGLVLPGLLAGVALLCVAGKLTCGAAGKWMLLLGIGGVVLMLVASSMDYIDEAMDQAQKQMVAHGAPVGCPGFQQNVSAATDQAKKIIQTKTTPYLWVCLGLYVLIVGCGLATVGAPDYVPPSESAAREQTTPAVSDGPYAGWPIHDGDRRAASGGPHTAGPKPGVGETANRKS